MLSETFFGMYKGRLTFSGATHFWRHTGAEEKNFFFKSYRFIVKLSFQCFDKYSVIDSNKILYGWHTYPLTPPRLYVLINNL